MDNEKTRELIQENINNFLKDALGDVFKCAYIPVDRSDIDLHGCETSYESGQGSFGYDRSNVIIEFINGKKIQLIASEWAFIEVIE